MFSRIPKYPNLHEKESTIPWELSVQPGTILNVLGKRELPMSSPPLPKNEPLPLVSLKDVLTTSSDFSKKNNNPKKNKFF